MNIAINKREELFLMLVSLPEGERTGKEKTVPNEQYKILDTSVIIDGRIAYFVQVDLLKVH